MTLVGVSFSVLIHCDERVMRLKVHWKADPPPFWTLLVLTSTFFSAAASWDFDKRKRSLVEGGAGV